MSEEEDLNWFNTLAGRPAGSSQDAVDEEARALRRLISAQLKENPGTVPTSDLARESALIARAKAEGLLPARARRPWLSLPVGLAAAAMLATVVIGVYRVSLPPTETFRGVQDGTARLVAKDPAALREQLIRELRSAGVQPVIYERLGRLGLDAELPTPISVPIREILRRHHIPEPQDAALVIEIVAADTQ